MKAIWTWLFVPVAVAVRLLTAPGVWKARTALDAGDQALQPALFWARYSNRLSVVSAGSDSRAVVVLPVHATVDLPTSRSS